MTVSELCNELQKLPSDANVFFGSSYGLSVDKVRAEITEFYCQVVLGTDDYPDD